MDLIFVWRLISDQGRRQRFTKRNSKIATFQTLKRWAHRNSWYAIPLHPSYRKNETEDPWGSTSKWMHQILCTCRVCKLQVIRVLKRSSSNGGIRLYLLSTISTQALFDNRKHATTTTTTGNSLIKKACNYNYNYNYKQLSYQDYFGCNLKPRESIGREIFNTK